MFLLSLIEPSDNKGVAYVPELVLAGSSECIPLRILSVAPSGAATASIPRQSGVMIHLKTEALRRFDGDGFYGNGLNRRFSHGSAGSRCKGDRREEGHK